MSKILIHILNLSISGAIMVPVILIFRLLFLRRSRRAACLLWSVLALRLIIPFSLETDFALMPSGDFINMPSEWQQPSDGTVPTETSRHDISGFTNDNVVRNYSTSKNEQFKPGLPDNTGYVMTTPDNMLEKDTIEGNPYTEVKVYDNEYPNTFPLRNDAYEKSGTDDISLNTVSDTEPTPDISGQISLLARFKASIRSFIVFLHANAVDVVRLASYIWLTGVFVILGYSAFSYLKLRKITRESISCNDRNGSSSLAKIKASDHAPNLICDRIATPFILGVIKPVIYLPSVLTDGERQNILAHEYAHLKRLDHIWKFLGFALLAVHWFNPLMWAAYAVFCRDIEYACDETVIADMNSEAIKNYSNTLLACGISSHPIPGGPLAFGEISVKERIKAVLNYKKPSFWIVVFAFALCAGIGIFFMTRSSDVRNGAESTVNPSLTSVDLPTNAPDASDDEPSPATAKIPSAYESLPLPDDREVGSAYYAELTAENKLPEGSFITNGCIYMNPLSSYYPFNGDSGEFYHFDVDRLYIGRRDMAVYAEVDVKADEYTLMSKGWEDYSFNDDDWIKGHIWGADTYPEISSIGTLGLKFAKILWYGKNGEYNSKLGVINNGSRLMFVRFMDNANSTDDTDKVWCMYALSPAEHDYLDRDLNNAIRIDLDASDGQIMLFGNRFEITSETTLLDLFEAARLLDRDYVTFDYTESDMHDYISCEYDSYERSDLKSQAIKYFKLYLKTFPAIKAAEPKTDANYYSGGCELRAAPTGGYGYSVEIDDDQIHLCAMTGNGTPRYVHFEYADKDFTPDFDILRRIFFQKEQYDMYADMARYEKTVTEPGLYPSNSGYLIDLDGDGEDERVFVAYCGVGFWDEFAKDWCENVGISSYYYGYTSDALIYINGRLMCPERRGEPRLRSEFGVVKLSNSSRQFQLLTDVTNNVEDLSRIYVYRESKLVENELDDGYIARAVIKTGLEWQDTDNGWVLMTDRFPGDETIKGTTNLYMNGIQFRSECTWRLRYDGTINMESNLFYPWEYIQKYIARPTIDSVTGELRSNLDDYKLDLALPLNAAPEPSSFSGTSDLITPGKVICDITDGDRWLHLVSADGSSGWIDIKDLKTYVVDYEHSGLSQDGSGWTDEGLLDADILFTNLSHAG
ncbi:MAG: M56 family metallopeptidase [Lachnospiraceae bacterium]|nr:M56 family metallopeptidase [Lachnospiraceae bacterium]